MTPEYIESLRDKLKGRNRASCARESGISRSWLDKFVYGTMPGNFRIDTIRKLELWIATHPVDTPRFPKAKVHKEEAAVPAISVPESVQDVRPVEGSMGQVPGQGESYS